MLSVKKADRTSQGALADKIGWIDFGPDFSLDLNSNPVKVENHIPGGYVISFHISTSAVIDPDTVTIPPIIAVESPTGPKIPFGAVYYQGIGGYPALLKQPPLNPQPYLSLTYIINIRDIEVRDCNGCPVKNYKIYAADAEVTTLTVSGNPETWQITTDGGNWQLIQQIPSFNQTLTGPIVTGIGTNTILETGAVVDLDDTDSYVYSTTSPENLTYVFRTFNGNEGLALGIIITSEPKPLLLSKCCCQRINYLKTTKEQTFIAPKNINTLTFNGQHYEISDTTTTIVGNLATYSVTSTSIVATPFEMHESMENDVLLATYCDCCDIKYTSIVFACKC